MLSLFDRKELKITFSAEEQARVRDILSQNGIDYSIKTVNRKSPSPFAPGSRARTGTFGENLKAELEYIIYVKKADYERASRLIG